MSKEYEDILSDYTLKFKDGETLTINNSYIAYRHDSDIFINFAGENNKVKIRVNKDSIKYFYLKMDIEYESFDQEQLEKLYAECCSFRW